MCQLIAHKTKLKINNKQATFFAKCAGFRRFAYNWALAEIQREYAAGTKLMPSDADKRFNAFKKEQAVWAYDLPSCVGQEAIKKDLKAAFNGFFNRIKKKTAGEAFGFPQFKRKGQHDSFSLTNVHLKQDAIKGLRVTLPKKMGVIRLGDAIRFKGKLMSTTISREGGKWYASFLMELPESIPYHTPKKGTSVGVDFGIKHYVALSNGELSGSNNALTCAMKKLAREQRKLSRKQAPEYKKSIKASNNWKKQNVKIRKLHQRITNQRKDVAHKITTQLANRFETIFIEDLKVKNMTASAKGDAEKQGKNVRQKSGLNRSILDAAPYQFRQMIEYKTLRRGTRCLAVPPQNTSRECPCCGHISAENRTNRDLFSCVNCGFSEHADKVASINIEARGLQLMKLN